MLKFYICRICGNLIEMIDDSGIQPVCCGEEMEELVPGTSDGAQEKHIPVFTESQIFNESQDSKALNSGSSCTRIIKVNVGSLPHPMNAEHHILWILVHTNEGICRKGLAHSEHAEASFCLKKEEQIKEIYSYCNLHGLWVHRINQF